MKRLARGRSGLVAVAVLVVGATTASATHILASDTADHTTLEQVLTASGPNFKTLSVQAVNDSYIVRTPAGVDPQSGRETRRSSLAYFAQLTDFQLADEESPARVEFADPGASSAWRPQEAFHPFVIDASIRQINRFAGTSPVPQGNMTGNAMDFALVTGDQADNQQRNEVQWTRELLEGGTPLSINSGVTDPAFYATPEFASKPSCPGLLVQEVAQNGGMGDPATLAAAEAAGYTGVQDYDDYPSTMPPGPQPAYYDPDEPLGQWSTWPDWDGLMDRAQMTFTPAGLAVPSYWSNGNHDVLVQGNEDANAAFEDIATACFKALGSTTQLPPTQPGPDFSPDPNLLLTPTAVGMLVPPDPLRRFVDRPQLKAVVGADNEDNDHGFDFVPPTENTASNGNASYYAWDPPQTPGFRFINIDTNSEGGQTAEGVASGSSNGNIDDPQFQWLKQELNAAQQADKLIVIFGHHPVRSMDAEIADEQAAQCTTNDTDGTPPDPHPHDTPPHDVNPGCDRDLRPSVPIHVGEDPQAGDPRESFVELLSDYDNMVAYVAGHTHEHRLLLCGRSAGCGDNPPWWEINTSATADWPQQHRLIEVMDNRDGTLSIFGTVLDSEQPAGIPGPGPAGGFGVDQLASIGRTLSLNDPDNDSSGEGSANDRNVEMLLPDPREARLSVSKSDNPDPVTVGSPLTYTVNVVNSGPSTATAVTLTDNLPPTVSFVSATPEQGTCAAPVAGNVVCSLGDIPVGATVKTTIIVTPQTSGVITNQAEVESVLTDPNPDNNTASEQTTVNPLPATSADLAITKSGAPANPLVGDEITYSLSVINNGPDPATGVAITDNLPAGLSFVSATASQGSCSNEAGIVTCTLGNLADDATATAQIKVMPQIAGAVNNTASVAGGQIDPNAANNSDGETTQVDPRPAAAPTGGANCGGQKATITGTAAGERLIGTPGPDVIAALGGRDRVFGAGGDDLICGGPAGDRLSGGPGDDQLRGQAGRDRLNGGPGRNSLRGGGGRDRCSNGTRRSCRPA